MGRLSCGSSASKEAAPCGNNLPVIIWRSLHSLAGPLCQRPLLQPAILWLLPEARQRPSIALGAGSQPSIHPPCTEACSCSELLSLCLVQAGSLLGITLTEIQAYSRNGQAAQPPASVFNLSSELPLSGRRLLGAQPVEPGLSFGHAEAGRQLLDVELLESGLDTESQDAGRGLVQAHHTGHADSSKAVSHHRDKADQALAIDAASSVVPDDAEVIERPVVMVHCNKGHLVV